MMVSVITGQSHDSGAGMRWAVALGSTKTFSIPIKPAPTLSFCASTFHLRHSTSFTDYTFVVCCEFPQNRGKDPGRQARSQRGNKLLSFEPNPEPESDLD